MKTIELLVNNLSKWPDLFSVVKQSLDGTFIWSNDLDILFVDVGHIQLSGLPLADDVGVIVKHKEFEEAKLLFNADNKENKHLKTIDLLVEVVKEWPRKCEYMRQGSDGRILGEDFYCVPVCIGDTGGVHPLTVDTGVLVSRNRWLLAKGFHGMIETYEKPMPLHEIKAACLSKILGNLSDRGIEVTPEVANACAETLNDSFDKLTK